MIFVAISLVGTLVLVAASSFIMLRLGRRFGRTGEATLGRCLFRGILWSIPVCWFFLAGGGGHGAGALPLPAWVIPIILGYFFLQVASGGVAGFTRELIVEGQSRVVPIPLGDLAFLTLALTIALILPICLYVVAARKAYANVDRSVSRHEERKRDKKRQRILMIFWAAHLALTVAVFESYRQWHWSFMSSVPSGGLIPREPFGLRLLFDTLYWVGFPLVSLVGGSNFTFDAIVSPVFWFLAICNSLLVASVVLAVFYWVRAKLLAPRGRST